MSEPPELPSEIRRLLAAAVDSFEKIEVLLATWQVTEEAWTVERMAQRLRLPADTVGTAMGELVASGMLAAVGDGYRFAPSSDQRTAAALLCRLYDADRLLILREMSLLAMDRIRSSAARAFSDAFRFRRRDPGKGGSDA